MEKVARQIAYVLISIIVMSIIYVADELGAFKAITGGVDISPYVAMTGFVLCCYFFFCAIRIGFEEPPKTEEQKQKVKDSFEKLKKDYEGKLPEHQIYYILCRMYDLTPMEVREILGVDKQPSKRYNH